MRSVMVWVLVALLGGAATAQPRSTPEDLLKRIYTLDHRPPAREIDLTRREVVSRYFDSELTELLLKDAACQREEGGLCNLDFDPILNSQDFDERTTGLAFRRLSDLPTVVQITFTNQRTQTLVYTFKATDSGWRISDIQYPDGPTLKAILSSPVKESWRWVPASGARRQAPGPVLDQAPVPTPRGRRAAAPAR